MAELGRVAAGRGQPDAGDPRRRPGPRHGRRDQRPAAGELGRAPRAHHGLDHGLTPSGNAPVRLPAARPVLEPSSSRSARAANGSCAPRPPATTASSGAVSDSAIVRWGMTLSKQAAVGRPCRPARRDRRRQRDERSGRGRAPPTPRPGNRWTRSKRHDERLDRRGDPGEAVAGLVGQVGHRHERVERRHVRLRAERCRQVPALADRAPGRAGGAMGTAIPLGGASTTMRAG